MIAEKKNQLIFLTFPFHVELLHTHSLQDGSKIRFETNNYLVYVNSLKNLSHENGWIRTKQYSSA